MSDSLQPHGLQHTRPPFPSPIPGACSDSRPSSWWRHPTIWSSVVPFTSCLQSFPVFKYRAAQMLCHISRVQLVSGLAIAVAVALPLGFNSANINWASLLCVLCRNTKIKQDLWFRGVYSPEALFLLWFFVLLSFISSKFTIYILLYYSELSCPSCHKVAIFIAMNQHFLIQGSLRLLKHILPLPNHWSPRQQDQWLPWFLPFWSCHHPCYLDC